MSVVWADGPYAIVPEWLLDADVSDRAVRLFAILARHAQGDGHGATPSKRKLAERLRCAVSTIDSALDDLVRVGAVEKRERRRDDGSRTSNEYVLHAERRATPPDVSGGPPPDVSGGKEREPFEREETFAAAPQRKPNIVWDCLVRVTGFEPSTKQEASDFGKTVSELRAVIPKDATAEDIEQAMVARRRAWERHYEGARFTHRVLRGKWAELGALAVGGGQASAGAAFGLRELPDGETF